jgi:hypothetical protein
MAEQKKIDLDKGMEALTHLDEVPNPIVSARQFVILNFDTLQRSGKTLKALHDFFTSKEIDVGTFESFRAVYNSVKRARKSQPVELASLEPIPEKPTKPKKSAPAPPTEDTGTVKTPKRLPGLGLRPVFLADGTEIEIDPDTGARIFQIKSNKEAQEQE